MRPQIPRSPCPRDRKPCQVSYGPSGLERVLATPRHEGRGWNDGTKSENANSVRSAARLAFGYVRLVEMTPADFDPTVAAVCPASDATNLVGGSFPRPIDGCRCILRLGRRKTRSTWTVDCTDGRGHA